MISSIFSLQGRLNRAPFWGYAILVMVVSLIIQLVLVQVFLGSTLAVIWNRVSTGSVPSMNEINALISATVPGLGWIFFVVQLALAYPLAALSVKRRHDRNRSGIDVWIYFAITFAISALTQFGIGMTTMDYQGTTVPTMAPWLQAISVAMLVFGIYLFVVLGFLKGTVGPNNYGPDPLQG